MGVVDGALGVVEQVPAGRVEEARVHDGRGRRALRGGGRAQRAAIAGPVGGAVETPRPSAQIAQGGQSWGGGRRGGQRDGVHIDVAAVGGSAQQADAVGARGERDVRAHRCPLVPAARRGERQGRDIGAVDHDVDRPRRRAAQAADVVGVADSQSRLAGRGVEDRPGGAGAIVLGEALDEAGLALVVQVVGGQAGPAGQGGRSGVADLPEGALPRPVGRRALLLARCPVGEGRIGGSEGPEPSW